MELQRITTLACLPIMAPSWVMTKTVLHSGNVLLSLTYALIHGDHSSSGGGEERG